MEELKGEAGQKNSTRRIFVFRSLRRIFRGASSTLQIASPAAYKTYVPLGHYFSPFPDLGEIRRDEEKIWGRVPKNLEGIDLNVGEQLRLLDEFSKYYDELPFAEDKRNDRRYFYRNDSYAHGDGIFLYSMIRHLKPQRIIEVGSGYSSCAILDTNELFFDNKIDCRFIEPYPDRFISLIHERDRGKINLISKNLQDVDLQVFASLQANDILFIDSTHVLRINSDVNYNIFQILPALNDGVYIHIHDIFYPFEYPREWVYEGRGWNEAYVLRAFLQYNDRFKISFFSTFLYAFYRELIEAKFPLCLKEPGGAIWLRKGRS